MLKIRLIPGKKIGKGKQNKYQDKIIQISTDGGDSWHSPSIKEQVDVLIEIGRNEEGLYPQKEGYRGYMLMVEKLMKQIIHGIEERLANEKS